MIKKFKIYEELLESLYDVNVERLRPTSKRIGGVELQLVMKERNQELLNREFTNCWVNITPSLAQCILHIVAWHTKADKTLTFEYDAYFQDMTLRTMNSPGTYNLQLEDNTEITIYKEKEPMIIKSEKDPYGEEDWEEYMDMKEAFEPWDDDDYTPPSPPKPVLVKDRYLSFDDFLRFDLLGLAKLKELRRFFEDQIVVIEQTKGDDIKRTKGRVYKIRTVKRDNGKQVYLIDMMTKKGEKTVEVSNKYDKFKVKTPKKIKAPTDPYGEEDWELVADPPVQETKPPKAAKKAGGKVKPMDKDSFMKFLADKQENDRKEKNKERLRQFIKSRKASKSKYDDLD
jgi:hypothetical protein